jgi:hypothetical protein
MIVERFAGLTSKMESFTPREDKEEGSEGDEGTEGEVTNGKAAMRRSRLPSLLSLEKLRVVYRKHLREACISNQ